MTGQSDRKYNKNRLNVDNNDAAGEGLHVKRICLLLAVMLAVMSPAMAETTWYGTMMVDHCDEWVSLRDGPGTGCDRIAKVPLYAIVTDAEHDEFCGDFIYCNYDGQYGYILAKYLEPWADPEPEASAHFASDQGFSFDYDASVLAVDADGSEGGQSLMLRPAESDDAAYLEIMTAESVGMLPSRFLALNAPADVTYEAGETADGSPVHWFQALDEDDPDVIRVCYAVDGPDEGLVALGACPFVGGGNWVAQFTAAVFSITFGAPAPLRIDWAEATPNATVVDEDGEYVTIMADEPVSDVALLSLEFRGGEPPFDAMDLFERDGIGPDDPLVVKIAFPGDIPSYGVRYTDARGQARRCAIELSGYDGSLLLVDF